MANGFGHDQAKTMGIPFTDEPFHLWLERIKKPSVNPVACPKCGIKHMTHSSAVTSVTSKPTEADRKKKNNEK